MNQRDDVEVKPAAKAATGSAGRHVIAVIGIDRYDHWPSLSNAVRDASGAAELFRRLGFEEITMPLLDNRATGQAIQSLVTDDLMALGPDDSLVLFYAGHGGTRTRRLGDEEIKTGYLIPVDASRSLDKVATWLRLDAWLHAVSLLPAKHILVILDACHSGIALDPIIKWRDIGSWQDAPLATLQARRSRRIITSALDGQVARDSGPVHGHSLFTGCLLEGLTGGIRGNRGAVTTGSELGLYMQRRVQTFPGARQTPDFGTFAFDDRGEMAIPLAIARATARPEEPAMAASPSAWLDLIDLDDPPELAPGTEPPSGAVASRTGDETDKPILGEPAPAPPAAPADQVEPAPLAKARPHDLAFDDANALASAMADARARAAAAMEQARPARRGSRRQLDAQTAAEVQAARAELAAAADPSMSGAPTTSSAAPAGGTAVPEQRIPDSTDGMPRREPVEPGGHPRQGQPAYLPAAGTVPMAPEEHAPQAREIALDSRTDSASSVAEARSAPGSLPHTSATPSTYPAAMAPTSEPAEPSSERVSAPISRPRRSQRSSSMAPPLSPPTVIAVRPEPAQPAAAERTAPRHVELLGQLERLLSSQFEAVVFRARIPTGYLPGTAVSPTERAIAVLRYIEQQDQLDELERIVQEVVIGGGPAGMGLSPPPRSPERVGIAEPAAPSGGPWRWAVLGVVAAGVTLAVALISYAIFGHAPSQMDPPVDTHLGVTVSNPPDATPGITVGSPSDAQLASEKTAPDRATIHLHVVSTPSGAEVSLSGKLLGVTPLNVDIERRRGSEPLTIHRTRYQDVTAALDLGHDYERVVTLVLLPEQTASRPRAPAVPAPCPADMVRVPAETFRMGNPEEIGDPDEHPPHDVHLSAYCIDRTEVTVKAYFTCVAVKGCSAAPLTVQWSEYSADNVNRYSRFCNREGRSDHPMNCVDWNQAAAYCTWAGKRLPSEAEWEYAARGTDGRTYPWNNEAPSANRLNACGSECAAMAKSELNQDWKKMYEASDRWKTTAPVGSFPEGASPWGALDMAGNVWEWTADWYVPYTAAAAANPHRAEVGTARVLRGGAWNEHRASRVRAADRYRAKPTDRSDNVGFRCARGVEPTGT